MMDLKGKKIAVLGLGNDGLEMLRALKGLGAQAKGFGTASEERRKQIAAEFPKIHGDLVWEKIPEDGLLSFDLILETPGGGIYRSALDYAKKKTVPVLSDLDLACQFMKAPIIAVTGTNGKTTTVALLHLMLTRQGYKVMTLGGDYLPWASALNDQKPYDFYLLELDSLRLDVSYQFQPQIAVLLNIFPAHGDRHEGGLQGYFEAKAKIFSHQTPQDFLIHEATATNVRELIRQKNPPSQRMMFSLESPVTPPGVYGEKQQIIYLGPSGGKEIYPLEKALNKTPTFLLNLMAALAVARLCRVEPAHIQSVIETFGGLTSRMEAVRKMGDVVFVDDSRSTNIAATAWALSSSNRPLVWIAGGRIVQGSFLEDLPTMIKGQVKCIILYGSERNALAKLWGSLAPIHEVKTLKEAVEIAYQKAEAHDLVIFSPACPPDLKVQSGEMSRGEEFRKWVMALKEVPKVVKEKPKFRRI